jgi:hypothetical protein
VSEQINRDIPDRLLAELRVRFTYHKPSSDQLPRYEILRAAAYDYALVLAQQCPDSRERSLAFTKLEEVVMWANAAIARRTSADSDPHALGLPRPGTGVGATCVPRPPIALLETKNDLRGWPRTLPTG